MDTMVKATQVYLNAMYGGNSGYNVIEADGNTGWTTIYALIRALQIELGITATADNFGATTISKFNAKYPNGIKQQNSTDTTEDRVYAIIQGALWCKGYSTGASGITLHFYGGTGGAIIKMKEDAGLISPNSTVDLDTMMALLSMNQFKLVWNGNLTVQNIQQYLNRTYKEYIGLIPCDGLYGRELNKALIIALQAVEGLSPTAATGTFGTYTIENIPILPDSGNADAISIFKYALCCNGYDVPILSSAWADYIEEAVREFQVDYCLPQTGKGDLTTWMSLLISKGNPDRAAVGCDCATILDATKAQALYDAGYRYVGRYLTGTVGTAHSPKNLSKSEMQAIFDAGLKIFAIYQDNNPSVEYYNYTQGNIDAGLALEAAQSLGIPYNETIYFAVDYDMMENQVNSNVIPYFKGIRDILNSNQNKYAVGAYGSRNVCTLICNQLLATSSFVADMSTGYSGNMGYPIPENWAFDQFHEYTFPCSDGSFGLDKDAYSGRYGGFNKIVEHGDTEVIIPTDEILKDRAEYLLSLFKINLKGNVELNNTIPIPYDIVPGLVEAEIKIASSFSSETDSDVKNQVAINIENGEFLEAELTAAKEVYEGLEESLQMAIDSDGGLEILSTLTKEINNGNVAFGVGFSNEKFLVRYTIEEILWTDGSGKQYTLYIEITFKIGSDDDFNSGDAYSEASELATATLMILALLITACVLYNALAGGAIIAALLAAM